MEFWDIGQEILNVSQLYLFSLFVLYLYLLIERHYIPGSDGSNIIAYHESVACVMDAQAGLL
jgi:hypothetical protein